MCIRDRIDAGAGLLYLSKGRPDLVWAIVRAHWAFFIGVPKILKKRKVIKKLVDKNRIGPPNTNAIYPGSIVKEYYFKGHKIYNELTHVKK